MVGARRHGASRGRRMALSNILAHMGARDVSQGQSNCFCLSSMTSPSRRFSASFLPSNARSKRSPQWFMLEPLLRRSGTGRRMATSMLAAEGSMWLCRSDQQFPFFENTIASRRKDSPCRRQPLPIPIATHIERLIWTVQEHFHPPGTHLIRYGNRGLEQFSARRYQETGMMASSWTAGTSISAIVFAPRNPASHCARRCGWS